MPLVASFQVSWRCSQVVERDPDVAGRSRTGSQDRVEAFFEGKVVFRHISQTSTLMASLSGRQHLGALFNLVAYYVLALPLGITLAFHAKTHLGLQGLWIGEQ